MRVLLPLPVTTSTSPAPGSGTSRRFRPSASEMRRPEPYSSAITAASRAQIQGSRVLAGALVGVGKAFGRRHLDRLRQALADLGRADRRQRADLALAFPFEEAPERAQARQRPHQRAAADIVGAPHRHEGPDIAGLERGKARQRHPRAPMLAEKGEALPDVAGIGFQRLRRQPPFGAQMRQPARHLQRDGLVGAVEFDRLEWRELAWPWSCLGASR